MELSYIWDIKWNEERGITFLLIWAVSLRPTRLGVFIETWSPFKTPDWSGFQFWWEAKFWRSFEDVLMNRYVLIKLEVLMKLEVLIKIEVLIWRFWWNLKFWYNWSCWHLKFSKRWRYKFCSLPRRGSSVQSISDIWAACLLDLTSAADIL